MTDPVHTSTHDRLTAPAHAAFRGTARVVGAIYLAGMVLGIGGNLLILSILGASDQLSSVAENSDLLALGAVLWLFAVAGDAAHGILMFPVLRPHGERMAMAYFGARVIEATLVAVMTLLIVCQIPLSIANEAAVPSEATTLEALSGVLHEAELFAYEFGMVALGVSGVVLCTVLHRSHLLPRGLATWGLIGNALLLAGSLLQILGLELNSIHTVLGGLWEVFIGVWLLTKGFVTPSPEAADPSAAGRAVGAGHSGPVPTARNR
ncbi:MAG: hypothetical protein QG608_1361 [Actinomycetota bacterium]|nr:hypothetical protein [Actinomycetota bacterium]